MYPEKNSAYAKRVRTVSKTADLQSINIFYYRYIESVYLFDSDSGFKYE